MRGLSSRALVIVSLVACSCAGSAHAAPYTWQGGDGAWTSANWTNSAGVDQSWASNNAAHFTSGTQTLTLGGNIVVEQGAIRFIPTETSAVTVTGGTISRSSNSPLYFYNNTGGEFLATLTLNDVALRGSELQVFSSATTTRNLTVVFEAMRNGAEGSTIPSILLSSYSSLRIPSTGNLPDSVKSLSMSVSSVFDVFTPITMSGGTISMTNSTINTNGNAISVADVRQSTTNLRGFTLTGSGTLSATTMTLRSGTSYKAGAGTAVIDNVVTDGVSTPALRWEGGTNIVNGTTASMGNWSVFSGATLGGTGTLSFAPTSVLTGSAGSFFAADMTAGGLAIDGSLALIQTGLGVRLNLGGLLPTTGTTTLMSWTSLTSGTFKSIFYNDVEVFPDTPSEALGGGQVTYTPTSIQFVPVPEPATLALAAGAGAAWIGRRHVRRRWRRRNEA